MQSRWRFGDIGGYYTLEGRMPSNLRVLRYERLASDFASVVGPYVEPKTSLGRVNVSGDSGAQVRLTQTAEAAIYRKYRWVFEAGHYPRRPTDADRS